MKHKLVPVAAALLTALASANVAAESGTDVITDGWEVHGYGSMNYRMVEAKQLILNTVSQTIKLLVHTVKVLTKLSL